ncbi:response regulator transcription factor [Allonocardiopsis opalescens]|uniref:Sensory transduction protein RegX3 n=1 Tax=Allonocardiopsis opalescens TaxID=1144618 RepID=A0A2T0PU03_9ACTN|nr:response regulator transcription factor [Allonocardiopsis opalescens]PRX92374.1 DNA-binding response OmpR family regulator [Allonocardiopsis opalescens]
MRILLVEDDDGVSAAIGEFLEANGHTVLRLRFGADALIRHRSGELVLLDLGLPDLDGLDVLRKLRRVTDMPILVLTARSDERSVIRGLRLGADDYLTKPIRSGEMLARIDAVARRAAARVSAPPSELRVSDVRIELATRRVFVGGTRVELTGKEFDVLVSLASRQGAAVSREQVLDEVWGTAYVGGSRSLDVHMAQLRQKTGRPGLFHTIRGFGYRLGEK